MRLFLLLSAMLAGLTGLIARGPAYARAPAAIASALPDEAEQAVESAVVRFESPPAPVRARTGAPASARSAEVIPQTHPVDERRIE